MIKMKKYLIVIAFLFFVALAGIVIAALNLEFTISLSKNYFFPNETIPITVNVINREVTYSAKNLTLSIIVGQRTFNFDLGDLPASQSITKNITLPELPSGTYVIRGILNYTGYFGELATLETYNSFDVKFPEIKLLPRNIFIKSFEVPDNVTQDKPYQAIITIINNGTVSADLIASVNSVDSNVSKSFHLDPGQIQAITLDVTPTNAGITLLEARVYAVVDNIKYLMNYVVKNVFVKEYKVAKISFDRVELVDEQDEQINQNDEVKFKIYLKNEGDSSASDVKGILSSSEIKVVNETVDYILLLPKEINAKEYFSLKTINTTIGQHNLTLDISFNDLAGSHKVSLTVPIEIREDIIPPCKSDSDCANDEICKNNKCEKIVCVCGEIKNHKCIKYDCCSSSDCSSGSVCDISSHTCIQCSDVHCCPTGKIWCEQKGECLKPADCVGCPKDTPCKSGWPAHEGKTFRINEKLNACDMFETCHPTLQHIAIEAAECCESGCKSSNCHKYCSKAYKYSDLASGLTADRFKKCAGLYLIYGLGPAAKYMQEYYDPEIECSSSGYDEKIDCGRYMSTVYSPNAQKLKCQPPVGQPKGWTSDTDMKKNSCLFSDLPAHANMEILSTGTCVDYSISLTTLLRMVGYTTSEVYSLNGPGHEFNLVKFPGETKWNLIDTVGNYPSPYNPTDVPGKWYPYCSYNIGSCANDAGEVRCPAKNMVKGCS